MLEESGKVFGSIDLKSFYASVECRERNLNPMTTNLVVADASRTEKTICLAVSPALKKYGIPGRARLFEVVQKVKEINIERKRNIRLQEFEGSSYHEIELQQNPRLALDYIVATPRMGLYMKYSTRIYQIYLKYFSPEDVYAYSIDEIFCDMTSYLKTYQLSPEELITKVLKDVYDTTGITATAGIGTNLYLAKIAMDIVAKHASPDKNGVRIAALNERSYREQLWDHRPITDFWRVGKGYEKRLKEKRIFTMRDIARTSLENEELLYRMFGVNAELLIDHSWGWEDVSIKDIKAYRPQNNSISSGQVLHRPYQLEETRLIVKEMAENLSLDLTRKNLVTDQIVLTIGYDRESLENPEIRQYYQGEITIDRYGRKIPKHAHGTIHLDYQTSSTKHILERTMELFDRIIHPHLLTRRINITAEKVVLATDIKPVEQFEQLNLFQLPEEKMKKDKKIKDEIEMQKAINQMKKKYGKNAIIKGMNLEKGGTMIERNQQVGGHKE